MANNRNVPSGNFICNDRGGVTYVSGPPTSSDMRNRSDLLADVRVLADATHDLCVAHHRFWPQPYPIPEDVYCALKAADYGLARVRGGTLKRLAELDIRPQQTTPPNCYQVTLADLVNIVDATHLLESYRQMLVDNPAEQAHVHTYLKRLLSIVAVASEQHAALVYGKAG